MSKTRFCIWSLSVIFAESASARVTSIRVYTHTLQLFIVPTYNRDDNDPSGDPRDIRISVVFRPVGGARHRSR